MVDLKELRGVAHELGEVHSTEDGALVYAAADRIEELCRELAQARAQVEDAAKQFKLIEYSLTKDSLCDAERIDSALHVARRARSAPAFKAPQNTAERSPSSDAAGAGADTPSVTSTVGGSDGAA